MSERSMSPTVSALLERGVEIPAPSAVVVGDEVRPERIEAGAVLYPGVVLRGARTCVGAGSELGRAGGGSFEDVCVGRGVQLYGGVYRDAVCLDGVVVRGHAELRGGTLMEEGAEAAHHVGLKMTVLFPWVVTGSLINFCDALFAGGTSREDHGEIGSCLALYNYTPWGDKFASMFGDVPRGVFLRAPRVFVGGQTQVVSPVRVGYGTVIPAGLAVRRPVGEGRLAGETMRAINEAFDGQRLGALTPKISLTVEYLANLYALEAWYEVVRVPAARDPFEALLWGEASRQVVANIVERRKRLGKMMAKVPASLTAHGAGAEPDAKRMTEHRAALELWGEREEVLRAPPGRLELRSELAPVGQQVADVMRAGASYLEAVQRLDGELVERGMASLQGFVDGVMHAASVDRVEAVG